MLTLGATGRTISRPTSTDRSAAGTAAAQTIGVRLQPFCCISFLRLSCLPLPEFAKVVVVLLALARLFVLD